MPDPLDVKRENRKLGAVLHGRAFSPPDAPEAVVPLPGVLCITDHQLLQGAARGLVFSSEDSLSAFVLSLSDLEAGALYEMLHARGCRVDGRGLAKWRKEKVG